jgi:DNA excision repair protein ERCC-4
VALNVKEDRQALIAEAVRLRGMRTPVRSIEATEVLPAERARLYRQGGVLFATARTIVLDMLSGKLAPHILSGILVDNCHEMSDMSIDSFAVREYRRHNRTGFVKGFTDSIDDLVHGFAKAEKILRLLRVPRLFLWPRFRDEVKRDLEARPPEVRSARGDTR